QCAGWGSTKYIYRFSAKEAFDNAHDSTKPGIRAIKTRLYGLDALKNVKQIKNAYDGFEAIAIVGDSCYILIESKDKDPFCYLIKAVFDGDGLIVQPNPVELRKPRQKKNVGFEAMYYDPTTKRLKIFFEYNGFDTTPDSTSMGYEVNTSMSSVTRFSIPTLPFRLTDITMNNVGDIYGVNFYWGGEYDQYLRFAADSVNALEKFPAIPLKTDNDEYFGRIVRLKNNEWAGVGDLFSTKINWEGMAAFDNGFFLISDDNKSKHGLLRKFFYVTIRSSN
ncbi:MAG TPA: hypothetical protein VHM26_00805, partial [Chitinophagaceae bacterium]|nr:hypothetical protein [Chitinophagaceae bacterium]